MAEVNETDLFETNMFRKNLTNRAGVTASGCSSRFLQLKNEGMWIKKGFLYIRTQGLAFCLTEHLLWAPRLNNALLPTRNETPALCHATFSLLGS